MPKSMITGILCHYHRLRKPSTLNWRLVHKDFMRVINRNLFKQWYLIDSGACLPCFSATDNRRAKHLTDFGKYDGLHTIIQKNILYFLALREFRIVPTTKVYRLPVQCRSWNIIILGIFFLLVLLLLCTLFCPSTHVILLCYFVTWEGKRKRYGYAFPSQIGSKGNTEIQYYLHNVNIMLC